MNFDEFRKGPARGVLYGLGHRWFDLLASAKDFEDLRRKIDFENAKAIGSFPAAVRRHADECSSSDRRMLLAICALVGFAHLADELAGGRAWQDMTTGCDRRYRAAVAACMMEAP